MANENLETIKGTVRTITFHSKDNDWVVAKIIPEKGRGIVAVTGNIKHISIGETIVFKGKWVINPEHGRQFEFESSESIIPETAEGVKKFLASKYFKGIGDVAAERIVEKFGVDTLRILDEEPERLKKVKGLNKAQVAAVLEGWSVHRHIRNIMIFLRGNDISEAFAMRFYEKYKGETIDKLRSNPYCLIRDIRGIAFIKADAIAMKLGIEKDSSDRIQAGIIHSLNEHVDNGHVYVPSEMLIESSAAILDVESSYVMENMDNLKKTGEIVVYNDRIYRQDLYNYELELSQRLKQLKETTRPGGIPKANALEKIITDIEEKRGIDFAPLQRDAVIKSAMSNLMVLTGGPGTGKTTTVLGIIDVFRRLKLKVLLCAPTGRAAKRLSETTGMEAKTIHRLLEYDPFRGRFTRNQQNPLEAHVVIMDEASMVDTILMCEFLRAVNPYTVFIIVGDVDQLPSIGAGNVLRDIISSKTIATIRLTDIFRQAAASRIIQSAHKINSGNMPYTDNDHDGDFFFMKKLNPQEIAETIVDMVTRRLPARYGFHPVDDIQVLSPMHKSETGVGNLNALIQESINPFRRNLPEIRYGNWVFRQGDKVMQIRNDYDNMVFNGDIGRIEHIDPQTPSIFVRFDTKVEYSSATFENLVPAYAISVHKSQGSEFKCVVIPVSTQHYIMLKRNLLYTAVTRARELVVLVGDYKALAIAVNNDQVSERYTSLKERLME